VKVDVEKKIFFREVTAVDWLVHGPKLPNYVGTS